MQSVIELLILAQQPAPSGCAGMGSALMLPAIIILVFYFFIIRPQNKRLKEQQDFRKSLKVGDRVVTAGGIVGNIARVFENEIELEIATRTKIRIVRSQIVQLHGAPEAAAESDSKSDDAKKNEEKSDSASESA